MNKAWWMGVTEPSADAAGRESRPVNKRIAKTYAVSANRAGEELAMLSMKSRRPVNIHRPPRSVWTVCQLGGPRELDWA